MDYHKLNIFGGVQIRAKFSLSETAIKLSTGLGLEFRADPSGTYDEFPSFSAKAAGLKFALLGIPKLSDQILGPITDFELQIGMTFRTDASEDCDSSKYFEDLIRAKCDLEICDS